MHGEVPAGAPASPLDHVPISILIPSAIMSVGIYPFVWLLKRADGFSAISGGALPARSIARFCVLGIATQSLLLLSFVTFIISALFGSEGAGSASRSLALAYAAFFLLGVFPIRCFWHHEIRWHVRRAEAEWDTRGVMLPRTIPSRVAMTLLGAIYVQHHVNRLIGLGMPGFSGYDDLMEAKPPLAMLKAFLLKGSGSHE